MGLTLFYNVLFLMNEKNKMELVVIGLTVLALFLAWRGGWFI